MLADFLPKPFRQYSGLYAESWAIGPWDSKGNTSDTLHPFLCHSNLLYGPSQQTSLIVRFHFRNGGNEIHEAFVEYFNKSGKRVIPGRDGKSDLEASHMDNRWQSKAVQAKSSECGNANDVRRVRTEVQAANCLESGIVIHLSQMAHSHN